jgi:hypothetical protein
MQADVKFTDSVGGVTITTINGTPKANFGPPTNFTITYNSLPQPMTTVNFTYFTGSGTSGLPPTTGKLDLVGGLTTITTGDQPLATGGTSGSPLSGSLTINIPAGTANGAYNAKVTVTNTSGSGANNKND